MGSLNIFSSLLQFTWPALSVATFVVCLQIQKRHQGSKGVNQLVTGSALVMAASLARTLMHYGIMQTGLEFAHLSSIYTITSVVSLVGQVFFLMGLYHFGTSRLREGYDDLLDDLPS